MKIVWAISVALLGLLMANCGGGNGGGFTGTGSVGNIGAPYTVAMSFPKSNAVTQLTGELAGYYSRVGTAVVTDQNGNAVKDGTTVQLDAIDSIKAIGTIGAADSLTGSTLNDGDPTLADGTAPSNGGLFTTAGFTTRETKEFQAIKNGDIVLLTGADASDQVRYVNAVLGTTSVSVTAPYNNTYPNTTYSAGTTTYVIGNSAIGVLVYGVDPNGGNDTRGYGTTKDGLVKFRVAYPANDNTMLVGCFNPASTDTRYSTPAGYARTYVVASAGGRVSTWTGNFCFGGMASYTLTANPSTIYKNNDTVTLVLRDANGYVLPFQTVSAYAGASTAGPISATSCTTDAAGTCTSTMTCGGGNTTAGTISYTHASGASVSVTVKGTGC